MIQPVSEAEIPEVARLYQQAFPEALSAVFGRASLPAVSVEDVFRLILRCEAEGFLVAREKDRILGFILAVPDREHFQKRFLRGLWPLLGRLITGRYHGIGLHFIPNLFRAVWHYQRTPVPVALTPPVAQILSIVVDPASQGRGIGKALMQAALDQLRLTPARSVRLEVDAAKTTPQNLYRQFGFKEMGTLPSPRGPALVMALPL